MASASAVLPITEDDEQLAAMLHGAPLSPLLTALALATGDLSLLRDDLRPNPLLARDPHAGLSDEQRFAMRALALDALKALRDGTARSMDPSRDELRHMMQFATGDTVSEEQMPMLVEELGVSDHDLRAPGWRRDEIDPGRPFTVAVIGAGMSGLVAAHRLRQAGIEVIVLEKNDGVGGTWLENRYPGCRVDVPNHLYSYSFAQRDDWPHRFSPRDVLLEYFRECAKELDLLPHIRFNTEVASAVFDDKAGKWRLDIRGDDPVEADAVISAVGQLNRPSIPQIPGAESFEGPAFHSAEWREDVDLTAKRVAVIGTGASGFQLIPVVAEQAAEVFVFQRTPNWLMPTPDYHDSMPAGTQWLLAHVPSFSQWYRFWLFWRLAEGALPAARVDEAWPAGGESVSPLNELLRDWLTQYIQSEFADRPDLLPHVVPHYPPLAKRILLDNGVWARTLKRPNVHLVTDHIAGLTPTGVAVEGRDGVEVDVIVYATGFQASKFLTPMRVTGRRGADLHERWDGDARAYLGITVPGFPNFFCLYGPNTNLVANGSIIFFSECEVHYILGCIKLLLEQHRRALDCRQDRHDAFNDEVDEGNRKMAWGAASVNTWYRNPKGRIAQNWPFSLFEFWQRTREPDAEDFELL